MISPTSDMDHHISFGHTQPPRDRAGWSYQVGDVERTELMGYGDGQGASDALVWTRMMGDASI